MAIFSLHHTWLGKSHKDYKLGVGREHANYITRESSCTKLLGERAPVERHRLKAWLHTQETGDRKNARIIDKVMVALPVELTPAQREALVWKYCERMTEGRASWVAAIHDQGKDLHNPHAHIVFRDRDFETGKRVMMTTERGSTERLRRVWEQATNRELKNAGLDVRIDRRSLATQEIDREPGSHRGPNVQPPEAASRLQSEPVSQAVAEAGLPAAAGGLATGAGRTVALEEEHRRREPASGDAGMPDWTHRGGMVAQQRSATKWAKAANEDRNPASPLRPA